MKGLALAFVAFSWLTATGQSNGPPFFHLFGKVMDTTGAPISQATIHLISGADTLTMLSRGDGSFLFERLRIRTATLLITVKGYLPFSQTYRIPEGTEGSELPPIKLRNEYRELDPVTVTGVRPVVIRGDTVSYNIAAFPVREGSAVEDILRRLPGVEVDINGNVTILGKPLTKVLVNGKEFFGGDVLLAIRNLPADVIDKLQMIDDYGDRARLTGVRSGDASKILNVVLRPDKRRGMFSTTEAGSGSEGKYLSDAFGNAFSGERQLSAQATASDNSPAGSDPLQAAAINYADQWNARLGGAIDLKWSSESPHTAGTIDQVEYYPGQTLRQTQNSQTNSHIVISDVNTRFSYKPTDHSTLRLDVSASGQQSIIGTAGELVTLDQDSGYTKATKGATVNSNPSGNRTAGANLYYENSSALSRRRFSIEGGGGYTITKVGNDLFSATTEKILRNASSVPADTVSAYSVLHDSTTTDTRSWNFHCGTSYFQPLGTASFLEFGYRMTSNRSAANVLTRLNDSGSTTSGAIDTIDTMIQRITYQGISHDLRAAYSGKFHPIDLTAGFDILPGLLQGTAEQKGTLTSYHYLSILPSLNAAWSVDKTSRLLLSYTTQTTLPTLQQLSPFVNLSNPQYPVTGNPRLRQSYSQNLSINYDVSRFERSRFLGYSVGLNFNNTSNNIIPNVSTPKNTSQVIQAITYVNSGTTNGLAADYHLTLPALIKKRLRINLNGTFGTNRTIIENDSSTYVARTWAANQSVHLQLLIPDRLESDLTANYIITMTAFSRAINLSTTTRSGIIALNTKVFLGRSWVVSYLISQSYFSSAKELQGAPVYATGNLQWALLRHHIGTLSLTSYNLFNRSSTFGQSITNTTITQSRPELTGRYFILTMQLRLQRFKS